MHVTLDASRRFTVPYPPEIDADWLLSQLAIHQTRCNIRVASVVGAVWEIDLRKCYELLSKLPWKGGIRRFDLDDLVHNRRMSATAWLDCLRAGKDDNDFVSRVIFRVSSPLTNRYHRSNSLNTQICQAIILIAYSPLMLTSNLDR